MTIADLLITNGTLVTPGTQYAADILVRDGRIEAILASGSAATAREAVDAAGLHVLPGAIDVHTHVRDPGLAWKETWATAGRAAAVGGVTTIFDMPNTDPRANRHKPRTQQMRGVVSPSPLLLRRFVGHALLRHAPYLARGMRLQLLHDVPG